MVQREDMSPDGEVAADQEDISEEGTYPEGNNNIIDPIASTVCETKYQPLRPSISAVGFVLPRALSMLALM